VIWGERVFVTSAAQQPRRRALQAGTLRRRRRLGRPLAPSLVLYAFDKKTGKPLWERVAYEGEPIDKRQ
jgi:hypothetical protein